MKSLREVMDGMDWSEWSSTPRCVQKLADAGEVCDNVSGAVERREVDMDEKKEPTTAEAFAMAYGGIDAAESTMGTTAKTLARIAGKEAIRLLKDRMGAMEAALRGCRTHLKCADGCACDVCAALAGASTAPSLEEAEERAREVYEAAISSREHQPVALSLAVRAVVRLTPSGTVSASGPCGCGHSSCTAPALTDAPPVFTPSVPTELAMLIDAFADEVKTAEEYATRPKGGQQVTPTGDFIRCTPSMLGRLRWWANALMVGRTAVPVFTLEEVETAFRESYYGKATESMLLHMRARLTALRRGDQ